MSEPAFPHFNGNQHCPGLTKREWFAGVALPAIITGIYEGRINLEGPETLAELKGRMVPMAAQIAFDIADAMIAQSKDTEK